MGLTGFIGWQIQLCSVVVSMKSTQIKKKLITLYKLFNDPPNIYLMGFN